MPGSVRRRLAALVVAVASLSACATSQERTPAIDCELTAARPVATSLSSTTLRVVGTPSGDAFVRVEREGLPFVVHVTANEPVSWPVLDRTAIVLGRGPSETTPLVAAYQDGAGRCMVAEMDAAGAVVAEYDFSDRVPVGCLTSVEWEPGTFVGGSGAGLFVGPGPSSATNRTAEAAEPLGTGWRLLEGGRVRHASARISGRTVEVRLFSASAEDGSPFTRDRILQVDFDRDALLAFAAPWGPERAVVGGTMAPWSGQAFILSPAGADRHAPPPIGNAAFTVGFGWRAMMVRHGRALESDPLEPELDPLSEGMAVLVESPSGLRRWVPFGDVLAIPTGAFRADGVLVLAWVTEGTAHVAELECSEP